MKVTKVVNHFLDYYKANSKKNTTRNQSFTLTRFQNQFSDRELDSMNDRKQ